MTSACLITVVTRLYPAYGVVLMHQDASSVPELVPVYSVNPDRAQIPPKSSCQVEFFGFSATAGQFQERFTFSLGSGAKSKQNVFDFIAKYVQAQLYTTLPNACCYTSLDVSCCLFCTPS